MVIGPEDFVNWVEEHAAGAPVSWVSLDPERIGALKIWVERSKKGETVQTSTSLLAPAIGRLGRRRALEGRLTDALALDAVRAPLRRGGLLERPGKPWEIKAPASQAPQA